LSSPDIDLDSPRLSPIARSWLLQSSSFSVDPQPGDPDELFKAFMFGNTWRHPPPTISYEVLLALTWLRLISPTSHSIAAYRRWVAQGCPDEPTFSPHIPAFSPTSSYTPEAMHILFWDTELRDFMDVRSAVSDSLLDMEPSVHGSLLDGMIDNFENQLLHRMGVILQERRRYINKTLLLLEAVALCDSILDTCFDIPE
jgi:hypothetical protein